MAGDAVDLVGLRVLLGNEMQFQSMEIPLMFADESLITYNGTKKPILC